MGKHWRFTREQESEWPTGHRGCVECRNVKPFSEFHAHSSCRWGVNTVCKECRRPRSVESSKRQKNQRMLDKNYLASCLLKGARYRANKHGYPCTIELSDIEIPDKCPVLGVEMVTGTRYAATIDKILPHLGYVPGNIVVISKQANIMKNNATPGELNRFCGYYAKQLRDMGLPDPWL